MFSPTGLFRGTWCPNIDQCQLPNCIFGHDGPPSISKVPREVKALLNDTTNSSDKKRRKLENGNFVSSIEDKPTANGSLPKSQKEANFVGILTTKKPPERKEFPAKQTQENGAAFKSPAAIQSIKRTVSPPPLRTAKKETTEALNPRKLQKDPAGHVTRVLFLSKLHEGMKRLNDELSKDPDPEAKSLHVSEAALINLALDEEERIARDSPLVYGNVIKLRIVAYKKMCIQDWKKLRLETQAPPKASANGSAGKESSAAARLETGLSEEEEVSILPRLFARQEGLAKFGYVTKRPTEADISQARKGVEAAAGWEQCDRCKTRFQVFPERNEEGALTTHGSCRYHPGKTIRPPKGQGQEGPVYTCCNEQLGASTGCTTADSHVFKISEPKRLALVMQFEQTPPNPSIDFRKAVAIDCEMGYTVYGLELIRLTATAWPSGKELIDVLVRPIGAILDLNSRFSGVWPEQYMEALLYDPPEEAELGIKYDENGKMIESASRLRMVDSPAAARTLLFQHLAPTTPLIGHAIENDLNVLRIIHPSFIDTVLLYRHPAGLPVRFGLKTLMKKHLEKDIQTGGAAGHDSKEDARAAGNLVRYRVGREWSAMKRDGWTRRNGALNPPSPPP